MKQKKWTGNRRAQSERSSLFTLLLIGVDAHSAAQSSLGKYCPFSCQRLFSMTRNNLVQDSKARDVMSIPAPENFVTQIKKINYYFS